jgi:hypothetical protein
MYKPDGTLLSVYPIEDGKAKAIFLTPAEVQNMSSFVKAMFVPLPVEHDVDQTVPGYAVPVLAANGEPIGVLVASLNMDRLALRLTEGISETNGELVLIAGSNRNIVATTRDDLVGTHLDITDPAGTGSEFPKTSRGMTFAGGIGARAWVTEQSSEWTVIVEAPFMRALYGMGPLLLGILVMFWIMGIGGSIALIRYTRYKRVREGLQNTS